MGIFSKFFKKSQKSEPSDSNHEISSRGEYYLNQIERKSGYFTDDGVWQIERKCTPEYNMGTDSIIGGCGLEVQVTEYDLNVNCEIYTWQCEYCGDWHSIPSSQIPEVVKKRIRNRSELKRGKNPVLIDLREYKQKRRR